MHTSTMLTAEDFEHWRHTDADPVRVEFSEFCPEYAETDRIAVVSPHLEDGMVHVPLALLSLTTAFYDVQRARGGEFFDYPRHFALVATDGDRLCTRSDQEPEVDSIGAGWGNLDVWPETQWHSVEPSATAMLQKVYELQIDHLFWPEGYLPEPVQAPLSHTVRRFLQARLKRVHLYSTGRPTIEIRTSPKVHELVDRSLDQLPCATQNPDLFARTANEAHRIMEVEEFLDMVNCFEVPR